MSNDDLVPRLRVLSGCTEEGYEADIIQKAADRIEALEARVAELERALQSAAPPIDVITIGEEGGGHDIVVEGWRFPPQGLRLTDQRDFDCAGELARENARLRATYCPGHTDMMVSPESLDEWLEQNPLPAAPEGE